MNIHKNARLTFVRREEMVQDVLRNHLPANQVAAHYGVSATTVRKYGYLVIWLTEARDWPIGHPDRH